MNELSKALLEGKRNAIAKALSIVENEQEGARELIKSIMNKVGEARTIGITGPAGAGKSTLIDKIVQEYRSRDFKVAILAIDPTSVISGGAILGDRVRMMQHTLDENIFIRSMASRGEVGGISKAVTNAIRVLDAAGFRRIIIESVGAGQLDAGIIKVADVVIVVFNPQTGDSVQAIKAGLTEIGDIYVVNKADLDGAEKLYYDIKDLIVDKSEKIVLKTIALTGEGIKELIDNIENVINKKHSNYKEVEKRRIEMEIIDRTERIVNERLKRIIQSKYGKYIELIADGKMDPYTVSEIIAEEILR
ncbi:MAG: methylmalonyl Co-A mutase-associated GTPase MeaB [Candidatus Nitrosocaldaceae archaeon]